MMWSCEQFGRKVNIQLGAALSVLGGTLQGGAAALGYGWFTLFKKKTLTN